MRLRFLYTPVPDLSAGLAWYRDVLGWDEAWREGEDTVAFRIPGSDLQVMLSTEPDPAGPMYEVENLERFLAEHPAMKVASPPRPIPDGSVATITDPAGNVIFVFDQARPD
ncbi:VOC family protein [Rathayibacter sp. YIM 133350]|uniref:VOC family protein n=1 Tax=Rathayibacter sp. YIM 133350 TaxID=3131992 RepID=UPI00307CDBD6